MKDTTSPLADPGKRLLAWAIDSLASFAPIALVVAGVLRDDQALVQYGLAGTLAIEALLYVLNLVLLARRGQTLGKLIAGVRIVRSDGTRATLGRLFFLRMMLPAGIGRIPLVGSLFDLGDALLVFSRDRRTLHDRMADTIVIDVRAQAASTPGSCKEEGAGHL